MIGYLFYVLSSVLFRGAWHCGPSICVLLSRMLHYLYGMYILNTSIPPSIEESGWIGTELQNIKKLSSLILDPDRKSL